MMEWASFLRGLPLLICVTASPSMRGLTTWLLGGLSKRPY